MGLALAVSSELVTGFGSINDSTAWRNFTAAGSERAKVFHLPLRHSSRSVSSCSLSVRRGLLLFGASGTVKAGGRLLFRGGDVLLELLCRQGRELLGAQRFMLLHANIGKRGRTPIIDFP